MPKQIFNEETMSVKLCKECKGLGHFPTDTGWKKCPTCGGTGRIILEKHDLEYRFTDFQFDDPQSDLPFDND